MNWGMVEPQTNVVEVELDDRFFDYTGVPG
jgi:hypothetical protein